MKKLYHGSTYDFSVIDLNQGKGFKDFGKGFYATAVKSHAESIAKRNKNLLVNRFRALHGKSLAVTAYRYNLIFDDSCISNSNLNIKIFNTADLEWIKFIICNRFCEYTNHNYDIVIGPTADENTVTVINSYMDELRKSNYSDVVLRRLIYDLKPENLPKQYFFGTVRALNFLRFDRVRREIIL